MTIIHSSHSSRVNAHDVFFRELGETAGPDPAQGTNLAVHEESRPQQHLSENGAVSLNHPHGNPGTPLKAKKPR